MGNFEGKDIYVQDVFSSIAERYDKMNLIMTWCLLPIWQRKLVKIAGLKKDDLALDVCSGTGELAIKLAQEVSEGYVYGLDFCKEMLEVGREKMIKKNIENLRFIKGDALNLPFQNDTFQATTNGYALRNVVDIKKAISEMHRVTKKDGKVICLEASIPKNKLIRMGFNFYFFKIIPWLGRLIDKGKKIRGKYPAYTWLPESLKTFPEQEEIKKIYEEVGLKDVYYLSLLGGASTIYVGRK